MAQNEIKEQSFPRYSMHKYWGKKPAAGIIPLIKNYTEPGDIVLDPFAGYGVFCCEAYIAGRTAIVNDLNPIANFIATNLFQRDINLLRVEIIWKKILKEIQPFVDSWYSISINGEIYHPISILRSKDDMPKLFTYKQGRSTKTLEIPESIAQEYLRREGETSITDWYPSDYLIPNSRISAAGGMRICDLFPKRALACHARLLALIDKYSSGSERDLLRLAFTANLANCSKLVPPIKSRGDIAQGAWMTGFYIGETYIENNVLHYYTNRLNKAIKGKEDYLSCFNDKEDLFSSNIERQDSVYKISNDDAKHLRIEDNSIDYVFTDPPYGDTVPYFEQSVFWNAWLKLMPDYAQEIVISDSNDRGKNIANFERDIFQAISEIHRILKPNKHFSITYHSLSGLEWKAITNACVMNNFKVVQYEWLEQKTYPPRQLNRLKTIKGDVLVTFVKSEEQTHKYRISDEQLKTQMLNLISVTINVGVRDTNSIMMTIMEWVLRDGIVIDSLDVFEVLNKNFKIGEDGLWMLK